MPLRSQFANVLFITCKQPCLGQGDQVLMTVEFPSNFMVADPREFKKGNLEPWVEWRSFCMDKVEVPVDVMAVAVIKVLVAQEAKAVLTNFIRFVHNGGGLGGQVLLQQLGAWSGMAAVEKELAFR